MDDWNWYIVLVFTLGWLMGRWTHLFVDRIEKPHRWRCPRKGCKFKVSGSDKTTVEKLRKIHIHE